MAGRPLNLQVNDIVLIVEPNMTRGQWPFGRVTQVIPGPDGIVRTARVKTKDNEYDRPVAKLCLLNTTDDV